MGSEWRTAPRVCRCCLSEGCYKDISAEYYWMGEKEMYSEMLRECFDLTITLQESSSSSRLICEVCITRLRDAANFKKQVITSEKRFAEHLRTGTSLAAITVNERPPSVQEIKLETVKTEAVISDDDDDDPAEPVDDYDDDPDYDESDSLPLKFEALKKETMVDISFGDEIPVLNNPEMTIKRVSSKTKEKSPSKKIKLSKKELTIKPVKASGSKTKVKAPKEPKVKAPKAAKTSKKDKDIFVKVEELLKAEPEMIAGIGQDGLEETIQRKENDTKLGRKIQPKINATLIIENSYVIPFRSMNNSYMCFYCPKTFFDPKDLREHTCTHGIDKKTIYRNLPKHGRPAKIDVLAVNCRMCGEKVESVDKLKVHLGRRHDVTFRDSNDGILQFRLDKDLMHCVICAKEYHAFNMLNNHMNTHFDSYICETCGRGFMSYPRLRAHRQTHNTDKFPCHLCDKVFSSKLKRTKHVSILHKKRTQTKCPECGAVFNDPKKRIKHQEETHGKLSKRYQCDSCDKEFRGSNALSLHVRRDHRHERPHACQHCDRKFFSVQFMREHEARHRGELFQCEVCSSSFKWRRSLVRHMRLHDNGRHACGICGELFGWASSLRRHVKQSHAIADFQAV